ncbi:transient receptor potential channel pyrexia [Holotrichia oblita]|uniref:Transient receptor potential channel pyrexia n=1 Tax=Holotrichia oblita TaxID=644536 RepID=A0ACB9TBE3_HOLOL|nr:transient receptor potential channel pyrexia [Holotrichia oblita]
MGSEEDTEFDVDHFLELYPELKHGRIGAYDVTALQVGSAFTKIGLTTSLRELATRYGRHYVNAEDQLGRTPLHYAASNGNTELVRLLLESGACTECKFKYSEGRRVRRSGDNYWKWNRLFMALTPPDIWGRTPLHLAAKAGHVEIVRLLIENSADVNAEDTKGITPLLLAGCIGNRNTFESIVKILVEKGADVTKKNILTGTTVLFHAVILKSTKATKCLLKAGAWITEGPCGDTELHEAAANNLVEILTYFLDDKRITFNYINKRDKCGRTPAYRAAYSGFKECLKLLALKGADMTIITTTNKDSVLDIIFTRVDNPVQFLKEILDSGIIKDKDEQISLDFSILCRTGNDSQTNMVYNIINAAHQQEHIEILEHPLVETFLRLKWTKVKWFFYLLIIMYTFFVLTLSAYVFIVIHRIKNVRVIPEIARYILAVLAAGLLTHAIIQSLIAWKRFYKKFELWMNVCCTSLALTVAVVGVEGEKVEDMSKWKLHAISIAILLSWTELMLLIGRLPSYGYYALMFAAVLQNVIKVLLTFICLVIGFALSFSIQFHNYPEFKDPWRAVVKTTVMMMGEFEYADLFTQTNNGTDIAQGLPTTSRVIFLMFVIVASIVLMNLMVGLAVSDIQGLTQVGNVRRLEKQAEFLHQCEKVVAKMMSSGIFPTFLMNLLARKRAIYTKFVVQSEKFGTNRNGIFGVKKLPAELLEKITAIANRKSHDEEDIFQNENLPRLIETMKLILKAYESRSESNH